MKNKILKIAVAILTATAILVSVYVTYKETGKIDTDKINEAVETIVNTYEMSQEEIQDLPTKKIIEQTEEEEKVQEQEVENEGFELQGQIAYEGDKARTWNVELGDYKGLTYYSQLDSRWSNNSYTSCNNSNQTIGSSGCAPTTASMIVTATRGVITPDKMSELFVKYRLQKYKQWNIFKCFQSSSR